MRGLVIRQSETVAASWQDSRDVVKELCLKSHDFVNLQYLIVILMVLNELIHLGFLPNGKTVTRKLCSQCIVKNYY